MKKGYTETHEWLAIDESLGRVGITKEAAQEIGEIVHCELPQEETFVRAGEVVAVLESTKSAIDLHSPATGKITKVNQEVGKTPALLHQDPEGEGWLYELQLAESADTAQLLTQEAYRALLSEPLQGEETPAKV